MHQNVAARATGLLLLKELVEKRKGVVIDAFEDEGAWSQQHEPDDAFAQSLIDLWRFKSEEALDPLFEDDIDFNEKCSFAMKFLLCVLELIQVRRTSGDFELEGTLVEALYVQMVNYINAFSTLGKSPVEDVSNNQAAFTEVLSQLSSVRSKAVPTGPSTPLPKHE